MFRIGRNERVVCTSDRVTYEHESADRVNHEEEEEEEEEEESDSFASFLVLFLLSVAVLSDAVCLWIERELLREFLFYFNTSSNSKSIAPTLMSQC